MNIREPTAMILCLFILWLSILLEGMYHLTVDLDLAWANWTSFINQKPTTISSIFRVFSYS